MASIKKPVFEKNENAALNVYNSQYLHELLWVDLVNLKVAEFLFHIEYRTSEFILEIPKLNIYIENSGVYSDDVMGWILSESKLDIDGAIRAITSLAPIEDRIEEFYSETFDFNYLSLLAYLSQSADFINYDPKQRWGVTLNESAEDVLIKHAYAYFEPYEWENGVAILHPSFKQKHSWGKLDEESKEEIVEFLLWAAQFKTKNKYFNLCAKDFLACIALHPKTKTSMLNQLKSIKDDNVQKILKLRKS